jgi:transposase
MGDRMTGVLTDGQWAVLAPLIEACRPHHKTQHHDLRWTTLAIIWRCQNGAKWRSLPAEFGAWWMAAQTFIRPRRPAGRRSYGDRISHLLTADGED